MLDERAAGDPLEGARIMLAGRAEEAVGEPAETLRRRYLSAHPSAEAFVDFKDFSFFRIVPSGAHLVAGFGRIIDLKPAQFMTDLSDAGGLMEAEEGAVEHMNADHREAMNLYATRLLGAASADWSCTGCDPDGMDMQAGAATLRLDFPERVTSGGNCARCWSGWRTRPAPGNRRGIGLSAKAAFERPRPSARPNPRPVRRNGPRFKSAP